MPAPALQPVHVVRGLAQAAALMDPMRLRLVRELAEPDSASGLAKRLGLPRQRVNYHLHELEAVGLVRLVEERRKRNCTERIVRAVARSYLISPQVFGESGEATTEDRLSSAYLIATAARAIRDLAELRERADRAKKPLASLTLEAEVRFADAADRQAFAEDLANEFAKLVAEYHDDTTSSGRSYRFFVGGYPAITKPESDDPAPAPVTISPQTAHGLEARATTAKANAKRPVDSQE